MNYWFYSVRIASDFDEQYLLNKSLVLSSHSVIIYISQLINVNLYSTHQSSNSYLTIMSKL